MSVIDDLSKGVTLGDADGPMRFIEQFGCEVPTFVDPRNDLKVESGGGSLGSFKHLDHHVPFQMRGDFKPEDWPEQFRLKMGQVRTSIDGFVLCVSTSKRSGGGLCGNKAVNRSVFCRNHGAALHPADKKASVESLATVPFERVAQMDRPQQFMQGFLKVEDLTDEEVKGNYVLNNAGQKIKSRALGKKFESDITKELHRRLQDYLRSKAPRAVEIMYDLADSDMVEPADRIKAATWLAERVIGKQPEVLLHGSTDAPYVGIMDNIQSGSREDYRQKIESSRIVSERSGDSDSNRILEAEVVPEDVLVGTGGSPHSSNVPEQGIDELPNRSETTVGRFDQAIRESGHDNESGNGARTADDVLGFVNDAEAKRAQALAARERLKKARNRRYAARAVGATTATNLPFVIKFDKIAKSKNFNMRFFIGDDATPGVVDKATIGTMVV